MYRLSKGNLTLSNESLELQHVLTQISVIRKALKTEHTGCFILRKTEIYLDRQE